MAISAKFFVLAGLSFLVAGGAQAQQAGAAPADRCEGTLCDLYYGSRGSAAETAPKQASAPVAGVPAGATPIMAPSSGTLLTGNPLSRWFGGSSSSDPATTRPQAPPSEPASATNSYMHLGTGGLLGDKQERCSGTLCDFYYGSSPSEPATAGQRQAATSTASAAEPVISTLR